MSLNDEMFYRSAFLRFIQHENRCKETGKSCREPERCGCDTELVSFLEEEARYRETIGAPSLALKTAQDKT